MNQLDVESYFASALQSVGANLTHQDLRERYSALPSHAEGPAASDLDQCKFYEMFAADPEVEEIKLDRARKEAEARLTREEYWDILSSNKHHPLRKHRRYDFRLNDQEKSRLAANGFAVSQRLQAKSFADIYYQLYSDDMPVYITADSVLHAWHQSFDALLIDLEKKYCFATVEFMLQETLAHGSLLFELVSSNPVVSEVLEDVDLFLSMAQSLLAGKLKLSLPANTEHLRALWNGVQNETLTSVQLFGSERQVDFSLFKPRGHYAASEKLSRYFQALTWLGTVDFRVAGGEIPEEDIYQLQCALVLVHLMRKAQQIEPIASLASLISSLVSDGGVGADSMSPLELHELVPLDGPSLLEIYFPNGSPDVNRLLAIQQQIQNCGLGAQLIDGHPRDANPLLQTEATSLPTSFALFGQQFVWSAFIFSRLVYDQVVFEQTKVGRRIPSAVDVAFSLFGNDGASEVLAERMSANEDGKTNKDFVKFRDGIPYTSNLLALRATTDHAFEQSSKCPASEKSISTLWVEALRELSQPAAREDRTFQSKEWQMRQMNTQFASYTQLRHDTLLYAKQGMSYSTCCEYAAGFVDPYPRFWSRMHELVLRMADLVENFEITEVEYFSRKPVVRKMEREAAFFREFGKIMQTLEDISQRQCNDEDLDDEQVDFLKSVMEERRGSGASRYLGWYPKLFYTKKEDSSKRDVLVADVHTDLPSDIHGDPGAVMHWGVGDVNFGFFAVNNAMYAGPVFSSYEFMRSINDRWNDKEFEANLASVTPPQWALDSFLCE